MKFFAVLLFVFICIRSASQPVTIKPGSHDSTDAIITKWVDATEVIFPADSVQFAEELSIYVDSISKWQRIPLHHLLRFIGKARDEYVFMIQPGAMHPDYPGSLTRTLANLSKGYILGQSCIGQLFLKLNLTAHKPYAQHMIFLIDQDNTVLNAVFSWNSGLVADVFLPSASDTRGPTVRKTYGMPTRTEQSLLRSNSLRDYIEVPDTLLTLSLTQYEELASNFLSGYFKTRFGLKAILVFKAPPTVELDRVKGYISGADGYWEKVQVKLDNIQRSERRLLIQCSLDGAYIKIKTPDIEPSAFERPYVLENDYQTRVNACGLEIISAFKKYILNLTKK